LTEHQDPSYWQIIGGSIAGILTGAGAVFGVRKQTRTATGDKVRAEIRGLQDTVLTMTQDIHHMQEAHKAHVATVERLGHEHDIVISELFREIKNIGLSLREVATEVKYALERSKDR
jgi:hypothetical protein